MRSLTLRYSSLARGNHEVMMRGTYANIRIKNQLVPGIEGGVTRYLPTGEVMPIRATFEKASLISTRSTSATVRPASAAS